MTLKFTFSEALALQQLFFNYLNKFFSGLRPHS